MDDQHHCSRQTLSATRALSVCFGEQPYISDELETAGDRHREQPPGERETSGGVPLNQRQMKRMELITDHEDTGHGEVDLGSFRCHSERIRAGDRPAETRRASHTTSGRHR